MEISNILKRIIRRRLQH